MYIAAKGSTHTLYNSSINGLYFSTSAPIDPLVREYFVRQGAAITQEDNKITLHGPYSLGSQDEIFAEIEKLSNEIHGEIAYDLKPHIQTFPWGKETSYQVVSTKPIPESKITKMRRIDLTAEETKIIQDLTCEYFASKDFVTEIDAAGFIHVKGELFIKDEWEDWDEDEDAADAEIRSYIEERLKQIPLFTFDGFLPLDKIIYHPAEENRNIPADEQPRDIQHEASYFYNPFTWLFGRKNSDSDIDEEQSSSNLTSQAVEVEEKDSKRIKLQC